MPSLKAWRVIAVIVEDLRRQEKKSGCAVDHHGSHVQVDGSFDLAPIVAAVMRELNVSENE